MCGEAKTGSETVAKAIELRPDVVLLDERLPGLSGAEVAREISHLAATILRLTLTSFTSVTGTGRTRRAIVSVRRERKRDTRSWMRSRDVSTGPRPTAIVRLPAMSPSRDVLQSSPEAVERNVELSAREREVLRYVADGKSNKEIGVILGISTRTVETHRARLMRKLDLHSMNQLVRFVSRFGSSRRNSSLCA